MPKFIPRERKHRRLAKTAKPPSSSEHVALHADQEVSMPPVKEARKEEKRRQLLADQPESKISWKKKKRLDKYIETKLKKEENLELLKKLSAHKVDTSLLQSAKKLGRVGETKRERFQQALKERSAGVDIRGNQDEILFEKRQIPISATPATDSSIDSSEEEDSRLGSVQPVVASTIAGFGSGLKRPLETDENGRPVIQKRKRRKPNPKSRVVADAEVEGEVEEDQEDEDDWKGFSSEDEPPLSAAESSEDETRSISTVETAEEEGDEEDGSVDEDDYESDDQSKKPRVSAFKAWADSQRNKALDFTPSTMPVNDEAIRATFQPRAPSPDAVATEMMSTATSTSAYRPAAAVLISRPDDVDAARNQLPVVQDEQRIMEAIHSNPVTVVCGATGSGKTTQLPQMLLENGYASTGMIGVTQPRRVAATSVAKRVSYELGTQFSGKVAHQVRFDSSVSQETKIKFMTDGILLREISQDFALSKYSAIIIDEAHERSVNTDILIGMLSRIVPLRQELSEEEPNKYKPLKLIVMSATLRVTDFILNDRLFPQRKPPVIQAEGRQYSVTEHFARRTQRDYVDEIVHKVSRGHRKLPPGSILVFLTGQDEIQTVARRLKEKLASNKTGFSLSKKAETRHSRSYIEEAEHEGDYDSDADIIGLDEDDAEDAEFEVEDEQATSGPRGSLTAHILPLYAALPPDQQMKIFEPPPDGARAVILATNVAETSLTIPGVKYVFDCGRSKDKRYDTATGVQEFHIDWISKASAAQRMGRAGRTGPGHCYRLYSSAVYERYFEEHTAPEILRTPIEGTVLQLKDMEVENVVNFPFPTPPAAEQLAQAERLLKNLGAIDAKRGSITSIGKDLVRFPVNPRFGKMLILGLANGVHDHAVALVAGLAVGDLFTPGPRPAQSTKETAASGTENSDDEDNRGSHDVAEFNSHKQAYGRAQAVLSAWDDKSDAIKLLTAVAAHAAQQDQRTYCAEYFLREKGMDEVQQMRRQLHNIISDRGQDKIKAGTDVSFKAVPPVPKDKDISLLKQIVAAGYVDHVAIRADLLPTPPAMGRKPRRAIEVAYRSLLPSVSDSDVDRALSLEEQEQHRSVFVHPSSVLAKLSTSEMPPYLVYSHLSRATPNAVGSQQKRTRMHPLTTVGPKQLAALAEGTPLLDVGKPIGKIVDVDAKHRECWVGIAVKDPNAAGMMGWPLPAWKVRQVRKGKDWVIEKVLDRGG